MCGTGLFIMFLLIAGKLTDLVPDLAYSGRTGKVCARAFACDRTTDKVA